MENKSISRTGFLNRRSLFCVASLSVVTAAAVSAGQTQRTVPGDHAGRLDAQICHPGRAPFGSITGVLEMWIASYSGVFDDEPTGMVVDSSGNVYVTGYTATPDYSAYVTINYNNQGQEDWRAGYNPPNG